ncbi:MAG: CRISPR-associated endoribonuclease Cas6, partial [Peptococcaceae bacterium]|nr:CRISPR-associated endoribonuclease Cas6 [Peptococcaceae bacterium]
VNAMSPIVAYSTFLTNDRKETRYFRPDEPEFNSLLESNLYKKSQVLQEVGLDQYGPLIGGFHIRPLFDPVKTGSTALYYKNFFIRGYMGDYEIECDSSWLKVALDTGLGSKNSQGLGMVEVV